MRHLLAVARRELRAQRPVLTLALTSATIHTVLASKGDRIFSSKKERSAVEAFYQARSLLPLWLDKGVENARAKSAAARLLRSQGWRLALSLTSTKGSS